MRKLVFIGVFSLFCFSQPLFAWNFSGLRQGLKKDVGRHRASMPRLALVFKTVDRERLKSTFNLVEVKRQLAHELSRSFPIADPVVTAELLRKNNLTYDRLLNDATLTTGFAERTQAELILLVSLKPNKQNLSLSTKLISTTNQPLSNHEMVLGPKGNKDLILGPKPSSRPAIPTKVTKRARTVKQPKSVVSQFDGGMSYSGQAFLADQNQSWVDMNPTAFLNPMPNYLSMTAWAKNLASTDMRLKRIRWEMTLDGLAQFGVQANGNNNRGPHSAYVHVKVPLVNLEAFSFAAGYRRRVFWNRENKAFNQGLVVDSFNDKRNKSSLFGVLSRKDPDLGILFNAYLDDQSVGLGGKYLLTEDIMAVVDSTYNFYDKPLVKSDGSVGVQIYNPMGSIASLTYRMHSKQVQVSFGYSF